MFSIFVFVLKNIHFFPKNVFHFWLKLFLKRIHTFLAFISTMGEFLSAFPSKPIPFRSEFGNNFVQSLKFMPLFWGIPLILWQFLEFNEKFVNYPKIYSKFKCFLFWLFVFNSVPKVFDVNYNQMTTYLLTIHVFPPLFDAFPPHFWRIHPMISIEKWILVFNNENNRKGNGPDSIVSGQGNLSSSIDRGWGLVPYNKIL